MNAKTEMVPAHRPLAGIVAALGLSLSAAPEIKKRGAADPPAGAHAANDALIPESRRNIILASMGGAMQRRAMDSKAIEAALQIQNKMRCSPPLDESEVTAIANSITRYAPAPSPRFQNTDVGNAARFEQQHRETVRYVPEQKKWLLWDRTRWRFCGSGPIQELAKDVAASVRAEAEAAPDDAQRTALVKHWRDIEKVVRIEAMIKLASSIATLVAGENQLDNHPMLLGVANGVVDLRTGALLPADRSRLMTRQSPVVFDASAKSPVFNAFIKSITAGNQELISFFQRMVGYALTGLTSEQCFFFFYGTGANGKSTLINVMAALVGSDYAVTTPTETLMVKRSSATNDIARLKDKRMVFANEIDESSLLAEQLVKQLVSGDEIVARYLYSEHIAFRAQLKLFVAGNHKPIIRGRDEGMWRRTRLVPFNVTIPLNERDADLEKKLRAELSGILNWAVEGTREWLRIGLRAPAAITELTAAYRDEMDVVAQWLKEHCVIDPTTQIQTSDAFSSYRFWCGENVFRPMTSASFYREMEGRFEKKKRNNANYYIGFKCVF